tara:strand:+ start:862 stop:1140 length:279 start_codon:yes stop_codon:yes gene_type:complete
VIESFLSRKLLKTPQDLELQLETQAYIVAKHYSISIKEVHEMTPQQFYQSYTWAMVGRRQEEKEQKKQNTASKGGSRETVSPDYSFLNSEEF